MGIFMGIPGGIVVAEAGMKELASRISSTVVLKRLARLYSVSPVWAV
jgi:hypothetical protein